MKRIAKFLARLYPSPWRNRYATEFEALLEDKPPSARDIFNVLWSALKMQLTSRNFVHIVLPCSIAGTLIAGTMSFISPSTYVSKTIFTQQSRFDDNGACGNQRNLPDTLRGPKPDACIDEEKFNRYLQAFREDGFSRDLLASIIQAKNLYPWERSRMPLDAVVDKMQRSIHIITYKQEGNPFQFAVEFMYSDPHIAQQVDRALVSAVTQRVELDIVAQFLSAHPDPRINPSLFANPKSYEALQLFYGASLPQRPNGLSQTQCCAVGGFTGLVCGLLLVTILGRRNNSVTSNG